ncbi:LptA/OstA family protein [Acaryochloris sp. IP29b_bin.148]|uniref:LptA/OstA family protein n=1 Tax=Acaryochloris sp. IP29b_bin.148 TaxID=2969218 RepID=UPI0026279A0A|nr:LptA/OstA family protein [Acaryochloris sp. IP29b_bin.148]
MSRLRVNLVCIILLGLGAIFLNPLQAQNQRQSLTLRADIQRANAKTGVITAAGNVQIIYPEHQLKATATKAQYFSRERRILLEGDVLVEHAGNNLEADKITYLIDEGRFEAQADDSKAVETNVYPSQK